jgi:glycosyltransferase involved in cell wall biosynthesis
MASKRIAFAVTNDWTHEQRGHRIVSTLTANNFDIVVFSKKAKISVCQDYSIQAISPIFSKGMGFYAEFNIRLFLKIMWGKFDILVANDLDTLPACYFAAKLKGAKLYFDAHEWFTEVPELVGRNMKKKMWALAERLFVPCCDGAYTVCQPIADFYFQKFGLNMQVVRNLPIRKYSSDYCEIDWLAAIKKRRKIILYQGAVNIGRGLELMIDAMTMIDDAVFVVIGGGDIFEKLRRKVIDLQLTEKVIFTGSINFDKLADYTQYADLGISLEEAMGLNYIYSLPNKLFDYIQSGVPVLISGLPEAAKIVEIYQVGEIAANQPDSLAKQVSSLFADSVKISKFRRNCFIAAEILNWENEKSKLLNLYT